FRAGWMLAEAKLARACETVQSQATTSIATVAQLATIAALRGDQACVEQMRVAYAERRERIVTGLRAIPGVQVAMPAGAFYAFADVRPRLGKRAGAELIATDLDFARVLLDQQRLAVVPGSAFNGPGYLRLSYAASVSEIDRALTRLSAFVASLL